MRTSNIFPKTACIRILNGFAPYLILSQECMHSFPNYRIFHTHTHKHKTSGGIFTRETTRPRVVSLILSSTTYLRPSAVQIVVAPPPPWLQIAYWEEFLVSSFRLIHKGPGRGTKYQDSVFF